MRAQQHRRLPADRQPYDALNGLRVGAIAGALLGATVALFIGIGMWWFIVGGGAVGGTLGYRHERRSMRDHAGPH